MANIDDKTPGSPEDQIRQLQKENNRLQRIIKRHETQLLHLDKMASANEKTNIALYKELEVLQQQTESQAREAQIEAALERVRARTMAMYKTDELKSAIAVVFEQLKSLGFDASSCSFIIFDKNDHSYIQWLSGFENEIYPQGFHVPYFDHPYYTAQLEGWQSGQEYIEFLMTKALRDRYGDFIYENSDFKNLPQETKDHIAAMGDWFMCNTFMKHGAIEMTAEKPLHEKDIAVLKRFASTFEQTYTRFLDLQKAEAQAREAQIEAALERVRARSMAMHNSDELFELVKLLYKEIDSFGVSTFGISIAIFREEENAVEYWFADHLDSDLLQSYKVVGQKHPVFRKIWEAWENNNPQIKIYLEGEEKRDFDTYQFERTDFSKLPEELKQDILNYTTVCLTYTYTKYGYFESVDLTVPDEENAKILIRFAKVFEQTYTRFLDLQKAEAQTREAQIQLALERVRAKAMSMQNSDELNEVLSVMFEQFDILGIEPKSVHLSLMDIENNGFSFRLTGIKGERNIGEQIIDLNEMPNWAEVVDKWKNSEPHSVIFIEYPPELLPKFWEVFHDSIHSIPEHARMQMEDFPDGLFGVGGHNKFGYIGFYHSRRATGEEVNILIRVAREFEGLYQRFLDLQKAEAHAREAVQQASLDRVRAEIASMRTADDLQRITPLIWRELTTLGVPFFRCGVFIVDEATEHTHVYLSTPSGEAVAALHLKFDSAPVVQAVVQNWRRQQVYREEWNREQFIAWTQSILKQGLIDSPEKYQAGGEAPEKLVLHFVPFTQGMLYIGSSAALSDDEIELSQSLAKAFGMAYARYEDFQRLEAAKAQVEAALENLKKTQQQLVTQEKLASLGQLTAGIAHEIKNPLNFVNNFAALSVELAAELREEVEKRRAKSVERGTEGEDDLANIEEILITLEQNAEKINHHGQRADNIVKSMMQHARGSSGQRELADINHLLDEAVNLTYHGMRANDASFNITIEKEYDSSLGKIEVVPQDISRVFLNIANNAAYAAFQKQKANSKEQMANFSPTLSVATQNLGGEIEIRIRDNGNGIPQDIREKIFTPFFTTKPAGQGTGLGLSISHDIVVQQHRGEIKVETEEGKFTEFVVRLPRGARD